MSHPARKWIRHIKELPGLARGMYSVYGNGNYKLHNKHTQTYDQTLLNLRLSEQS